MVVLSLFLYLVKVDILDVCLYTIGGDVSEAEHEENWYLSCCRYSG